MKFKSITVGVALTTIVANAQNRPVEPDFSVGESYYIRGNLIFEITEKPSQQSLISYLNNKGVYLDKFSAIYSHEEKSFVDLSCFNCIIDTKHPNYFLQLPENDLHISQSY